LAGAGFPNDHRAVETSRGIPGVREEDIMRIIQVTKWMAASVLLLASLVMPGVVRVAGAGEQEWLDAMVQAVLAEQAKEEGAGDRFAPYVAQLATVRGYLSKDDGEAVYRSMNRFMEMLQAREQGIAPEAADRLFDYCYVVTPARYHDVSRHLHRLS
jgi:hypothetical protein